MTHTADNDDISPENADPPNKKALKLQGSREHSLFENSSLLEKRITFDLGYKLSKLEGQS